MTTSRATNDALLVIKTFLNADELWNAGHFPSQSTGLVTHDIEEAVFLYALADHFEETEWSALLN